MTNLEDAIDQKNSADEIVKLHAELINFADLKRGPALPFPPSRL